ncbi:MAG: DUF3054 domain-containing protein [Microbacteriaceae bacterium]
MSNQQSSESVAKPQNSVVGLALVLDLLLVLVFAITGRASHHLELSAFGVLETAWPFFIGLWVGWAISRAWRHPLALWPIGIIIWLSTVLLGLGFRWLMNEGVPELAFAIVATLTLALFLLGWRLIALLLRTLRRKPSSKN